MQAIHLLLIVISAECSKRRHKRILLLF